MYLICTQENRVRLLIEAQKMNSITPRVSDLIKGSIQYTRLRFIFNCIIRLVGMAPHFQCGIRPVRDRHDAQSVVPLRKESRVATWLLQQLVKTSTEELNLNLARSSKGRTFGFRPKKDGSLPSRATKSYLTLLQST